MASKFETLNALKDAMEKAIPDPSDENPGYLFLKRADFGQLVNDELVVINEEIKQGKTIACAITQKGLDWLKEFDNTETVVETAVPEVTETPIIKKEIKMGFEIESVNLEALTQKSARSGGAGRPQKYPFDSLEVGQGFFVPATEKTPDPAKSLASVVTNANKRFGTPIPGQFRKNKYGEDVPKLDYSRRFVIKPFNKEINGEFVPGAFIARTK